MGIFMIAAGMYALNKVTDAISESNINIDLSRHTTPKNGGGSITYEEQEVPKSLVRNSEFSGSYSYGNTKQIEHIERKKITYKCPGCGASIVGVIGDIVKCEYCSIEHTIEDDSVKETISKDDNVIGNTVNTKMQNNNMENVNKPIGVAPTMVMGMGLNSMSGAVNNNNITKSNPLDSVNQQIERVRKLGELLQMGAITQEEFEAKKKEIMNL